MPIKGEFLHLKKYMKKRMNIMGICFLTGVILLPNIAFGNCETSQKADIKTLSDYVNMPFNDVSQTDWFFNDAYYVYQKGIMKGTDANSFSPNSTITRGMLVTILYNLEGNPKVGNCPFDDVKVDSYYKDAIAWAFENNIVAGYGNAKFGAEDKVTREQMASILHHYAKYKGYDVSVGENTNILSYDDAFIITEYAIPAFQWTCGAGVMSGDTQSTLSPKKNATRAEVASVLHRFCQKVSK